MNGQPGPALNGLGQGQHRHAGIAHRADLAEPGHALEVKAARFNRPLWRGQMRRHGDPQPRFGINIALLPMQRHAHAFRRVGRGNAVQVHLIQRQAYGI